MQLSFEDRTYLVTGGGSGIGKGVAAGLVAAGASVMIVGRNPDRLAAAVEEIKALAATAARSATSPPTSPTRTRSPRASTPRRRGTAGCTVWCTARAARETIGPITQIDSEAWRRTVDLNVNGTMYVLKHAAREMVRGGGGSFVGDLVDRGQQHPPLVRRLRGHQVGRRPPDAAGRRRTRPVVGAGQQHPPGPDPHRSRRAAFSIRRSSAPTTRSCTPLPRPGEVEDVANLAMFLLSDAAS